MGRGWAGGGGGIWIIMVHNLVVCISGRFFLGGCGVAGEGVACGSVGLVDTWRERGWREQGWMVPSPRAAGQEAAFVLGIPRWFMGTHLLGQGGKKVSRTESSETCERKKTQQRLVLLPTYLGGEVKSDGLAPFGHHVEQNREEASEKRIVEHHE